MTEPRPVSRERIEGIREKFPMHWFGCDRFEVWDHGSRQGVCDCTGDVDLHDLLAAAEWGWAEHDSAGALAAEVERLTSKYEEWESMHSACIALREEVARHEREAVVLNESIARHARDLDGAGESLRRMTAALDAVLALADEADEAHKAYLAGVILDRFIMPSNVTTERIRAAITAHAPDVPMSPNKGHADSPTTEEDR